MIHVVTSLSHIRVEEWSMGDKRSYAEYLKMVGLNMQTKEVKHNQWCHQGEWPEEARQYYVDKEGTGKLPWNK
jgi:hypothetical protein